MAARYWVGGTASWDATAGTKWSTTDGGAGGASVPSSGDDVYFTAASGAVIVTVAATANCLNINFTGFTGTFAGTSPVNIYGSFTADASTTWTHTGTLSFSATAAARTITASGLSLTNSITIGASASSATWTLGSALTSTGANLTVSNGNFVTANYALTVVRLVSNVTTTRSITLGSSVVTITGTTATTISSTGLTFNSGTSTIIISGAVTTVNLYDGIVLYNLSFTNTTARSISFNTQASSTLNNLTVAASGSAGVTNVIFTASQTINGGIFTTGTAGNRRVVFRSGTFGLAFPIVISGSSGLIDADFRDIYFTGSGTPLSGTRIGDLGGNTGITFDAPKTVYWNLAGAQNWSATGWASTPTGTPSNDYFPLAQDTAAFTNDGAVTGTITCDAQLAYIGSIDMSGRTSAMTLSVTAATSVYGNWTNGSGTTLTASQSIIFSGRGTQTITSAGKAYPRGVEINSFSTVQLADAFALSGGTGILTITSGTFDTQGYAMTLGGSLLSQTTNVRKIKLNNSTITAVAFAVYTDNLEIDAGTSLISVSSGLSVVKSAVSNVYKDTIKFYDVSFVYNTTRSIQNDVTIEINNLTIDQNNTVGLTQLIISNNFIVNGTLSVINNSLTRRVFFYSNTVGTRVALNVNAISVSYCDFQDIVLSGAAAGSSLNGCGDCGNNSGIVFPAPKTVYWNLAGTNTWATAGWASTSGGVPSASIFPLAQDTAVFDNAGSVGTITAPTNMFTIGTLDASTRTNAMTLSLSGTTRIVGDYKLGSGVTISIQPSIVFIGRGTQTIITSGKNPFSTIEIRNYSGTTQLGDALSTGAFTLTSGTFDAVAYNVSITSFASNNSNVRTLKMGSGTWTISGTGQVWNATVSTNFTILTQTSNIVFSDTTTTARTFIGGGLSYPKVTIGGATGSSTFTINDPNNLFAELASTKTVAHTIAIGTNLLYVGKWSITGTAGNVVTVTGFGQISVVGSAVSGVDYLAMGTVSLQTGSPGEFYAGANSTGTGSGITLTAAPAPRTLYWVGGTGNWSSTAKWSLTSGGAGGEPIPTSLDAVIFDSGSGSANYSTSVNATNMRCGSISVSGPSSGSVNISTVGTLTVHGDFTLAATGVTVGNLFVVFSGSTTGKTITTNGNSTTSMTPSINGVGCEWSLGSALSTGTTLTVTSGSFNTANYALTVSGLSSSSTYPRAIYLGSTTANVAGNIRFDSAVNLTFDAGTSQINMSTNLPSLYGDIYGRVETTFYNVSFTSTSITTAALRGKNVFNNLSVAGRGSVGVSEFIVWGGDQTINGTLTISAGASSACRTIIKSDTLGTPRKLTCNSVASIQDIDFSDITISGAAAPISGTRLGDCQGNSGITFDAPKTVYWKIITGGSWSGNNWGPIAGSANPSYFPLAQDTAAFLSATYPDTGTVITYDYLYPVGTLDMSARTTNTITFSSGSLAPTIYGSWFNGTGTTLSGTGAITFLGRSNQTITSAGKTFPHSINMGAPSGSLTLQDALSVSRTLNTSVRVSAGTFDANNYNVTTLGGVSISGFYDIQVNLGSGTWTTSSNTGWTASVAQGTKVTITGNATISLTSASATPFSGGSLQYSDATLNIGGAGVVTISGNNTFGNITNSYGSSGATSIVLTNGSTQRVNSFTATGSAGKILAVSGGTAAGNVAYLVITSGPTTGLNYININGVLGYPVSGTWFIGTNSIFSSRGEGGFILSASGGVFGTVNEFTTLSSIQDVVAILSAARSETIALTDNQVCAANYFIDELEFVALDDFESAARGQNAYQDEALTIADTQSAMASYVAAVSEAIAVADNQNVVAAYVVTRDESVALTDSTSGIFVILVVCDESVALSETQSFTYNANGTVNETVGLNASQSAIAALANEISESLNLSDTQTGRPTFVVVSSELLSLSDDENVSATFRANNTESVALNDTNVGVATFSASSLESVTIADFQNSLAQFASSIDEVINLASEEKGGFLIFVDANETVTVATTENVQAVFAGNQLESMVLTDADDVIASLVGNIVESVDLIDSVCAFGWFLIDDDQTPKWGVAPILVREVASYGAFTLGGVPFSGNIEYSGEQVSVIPEEQNPSWTEITEDGPTSWSDVDNNQNC